MEADAERGANLTEDLCVVRDAGLRCIATLGEEEGLDIQGDRYTCRGRASAVDEQHRQGRPCVF